MTVVEDYSSLEMDNDFVEILRFFVRRIFQQGKRYSFYSLWREMVHAVKVECCSVSMLYLSCSLLALKVKTRQTYSQE